MKGSALSRIHVQLAKSCPIRNNGPTGLTVARCKVPTTTRTGTRTAVSTRVGSDMNPQLSGQTAATNGVVHMFYPQLVDDSCGW